MAVAGEIDLYTAPKLHSELMTALSAATPAPRCTSSWT